MSRSHLKYRNRPTGGYSSAKEARRAAELRLLQKAGKIWNLREQVPYVLIPAQRIGKKLIERECRYVADFVYEDTAGDTVVEDCKGVRTDAYIIKRKLMLKVHGIAILETGNERYRKVAKTKQSTVRRRLASVSV